MPAQASLWLRGSPWVLQLNMPGFRTTLREARQDGSGVTLQAENPDTHLSLSAFIEVSPRRIRTPHPDFDTRLTGTSPSRAP